MITGTQLRMARAALKLGVRELATHACMSPATISRIESGAPANASTLQALELTLKNLGVYCNIDDTGDIAVYLSYSSMENGEKWIVSNIIEKRRKQKKDENNAIRERIKSRDDENKEKIIVQDK